MSKFYTAVKVRLYPNLEQEELFRKTIGCCRFIYNHYLDLKNKQYQDYLRWQKKHPNLPKSKYKWKKLPTESELKKKYSWLKEPDAIAIQQSRIDLETSFKNFFSGQNDKPKFHKKGQKESFRCVQQVNVDQNESKIKISKNGWIRARGQLDQVVGKVKSITVSLDAGKWYASILQEVDSDDYYQPVQHPIKGCGIDLGVKKPLTIVGTDGVFHIAGKVAKKLLLQKEKRRKRYQRALARKQKGSKNREKAKIKVQRAYQRERFMRKEFIEQTSHRLTMKYETIVFEDLNIAKMTKKGGNHKKGLNREMLRLGLAALVARTQDKAARRGGTVIFVDPKHTSQTCSSCGTIDKVSRESQSRFCCTSCGHAMNADKNAALNILARAGLF